MGKKRILVFSGCPDAPGIWLSGAMKKWADEGHEIYEIFLSPSAKGSPSIPPEEFERMRLAEEQAVGKIIGLKEVRFLDLAPLQLTHTPENVRQVATLVQNYRPDVVIGPWPEVKHADLREAGKLVRDGCFMAALHGIETGYQAHHIHFVYEFPSDDELTMARFDPEIFLDVSDLWEMKVEVLRQFKSVWDDDKKWWIGGWDTYLKTMEGYFRRFGSLAGVKYAEGFRFFWHLRFRGRAWKSLPLPPFDR